MNETFNLKCFSPIEISEMIYDFINKVQDVKNEKAQTNQQLISNITDKYTLIIKEIDQNWKKHDEIQRLVSLLNFEYDDLIQTSNRLIPQIQNQTISTHYSFKSIYQFSDQINFKNNYSITKNDIENVNEIQGGLTDGLIKKFFINFLEFLKTPQKKDEVDISLFESVFCKMRSLQTDKVLMDHELINEIVEILNSPKFSEKIDKRDYQLLSEILQFGQKLKINRQNTTSFQELNSIYSSDFFTGGILLRKRKTEDRVDNALFDKMEMSDFMASEGKGSSVNLLGFKESENQSEFGINSQKDTPNNPFERDELEFKNDSMGNKKLSSFLKPGATKNSKSKKSNFGKQGSNELWSDSEDEQNQKIEIQSPSRFGGQSNNEVFIDKNDDTNERNSDKTLNENQSNQSPKSSNHSKSEFSQKDSFGKNQTQLFTSFFKNQNLTKQQQEIHDLPKNNSNLTEFVEKSNAEKNQTEKLNIDNCKETDGINLELKTIRNSLKKRSSNKDQLMGDLLPINQINLVNDNNANSNKITPKTENHPELQPIMFLSQRINRQNADSETLTKLNNASELTQINSKFGETNHKIENNESKTDQNESDSQKILYFDPTRKTESHKNFPKPILKEFENQELEQKNPDLNIQENTNTILKTFAIELTSKFIENETQINELNFNFLKKKNSLKKNEAELENGKIEDNKLQNLLKFKNEIENLKNEELGECMFNQKKKDQFFKNQPIIQKDKSNKQNGINNETFENSKTELFDKIGNEERQNIANVKIEEAKNTSKEFKNMSDFVANLEKIQTETKNNKQNIEYEQSYLLKKLKEHNLENKNEDIFLLKKLNTPINKNESENNQKVGIRQNNKLDKGDENNTNNYDITNNETTESVRKDVTKEFIKNYRQSDSENVKSSSALPKDWPLLNYVHHMNASPKHSVNTLKFESANVNFDLKTQKQTNSYENTFNPPESTDNINTLLKTQTLDNFESIQNSKEFTFKPSFQNFDEQNEKKNFKINDLIQMVDGQSEESLLKDKQDISENGTKMKHSQNDLLYTSSDLKGIQISSKNQANYEWINDGNVFKNSNGSLNSIEEQKERKKMNFNVFQNSAESLSNLETQKNQSIVNQNSLKNEASDLRERKSPILYENNLIKASNDKIIENEKRNPTNQSNLVLKRFYSYEDGNDSDKKLVQESIEDINTLKNENVDLNEDNIRSVKIGEIIAENFEISSDKNQQKNGVINTDQKSADNNYYIRQRNGIEFINQKLHEIGDFPKEDNDNELMQQIEELRNLTNNNDKKNASEKMNKILRNIDETETIKKESSNQRENQLIKVELIELKKSKTETYDGDFSKKQKNNLNNEIMDVFQKSENNTGSLEEFLMKKNSKSKISHQIAWIDTIRIQNNQKFNFSFKDSKNDIFANQPTYKQADSNFEEDFNLFMNKNKSRNQPIKFIDSEFPPLLCKIDSKIPKNITNEWRRISYIFAKEYTFELIKNFKNKAHRFRNSRLDLIFKLFEDFPSFFYDSAFIKSFDAEKGKITVFNRTLNEEYAFDDYVPVYLEFQNKNSPETTTALSHLGDKKLNSTELFRFSFSEPAIEGTRVHLYDCFIEKFLARTFGSYKNLAEAEFCDLLSQCFLKVKKIEIPKMTLREIRLFDWSSLFMLLSEIIEDRSYFLVCEKMSQSLHFIRKIDIEFVFCETETKRVLKMSKNEFVATYTKVYSIKKIN